MKIEINKVYRAKFKNAVTEDGEFVEVEKIVSGLTDMEIKLKNHDKLIIACAFVSIFEKV